MFYVYILRSEKNPAVLYHGFTANLKARLSVHNGGGNQSTKTMKPWRLAWYAAFETEEAALAFERYLAPLGDHRGAGGYQGRAHVPNLAPAPDAGKAPAYRQRAWRKASLRLRPTLKEPPSNFGFARGDRVQPIPLRNDRD